MEEKNTEDTSPIKYYKDEEYYKAAEPLLKEIIKDYPETLEDKEAVNFHSSVGHDSIWWRMERLSKLTEEMQQGGKFIEVGITPRGGCGRYIIEIYVSPDLRKKIVSYNEYPNSPYMTAIAGGGVGTDRVRCPLNNNK